MKKQVEVRVCDMPHLGRPHDVPAVGVMTIVIDGRRHDLDLCTEHVRRAKADLKDWVQV